MTCDHWEGDWVDGDWVCARCWAWMDERPRRYRMVAVPSVPGVVEMGQVRSPRTRQEVERAPTASCDGMTLGGFIRVMARRLVARTRGGMGIRDAQRYAVEIMRGLGTPFGDPEFAWDSGGAHELVDEDMSCWDEDAGDGSGNGG